MSDLSLSGVWEGNPVNGGLVATCTFALTQSGNAVSGTGTGWLGANYNSGAVSIGWTLTGQVADDDTFTMKSSPSDLPLTFTGTIVDATTINGTLVGELEPGVTTTTAISCVQLDHVYPGAITGQWSGGATLSLSPVQDGGTVSGVGAASISFGGWPVTINGFLTGSVDYPNFNLELSTIRQTSGQLVIPLSGHAVDDDTLTGVAFYVFPFTLKRQGAK